jgi:hypothetical protein
MVAVIWVVIAASCVWVGVDAHHLGVKRGRLGGGMLDMSVASWVICSLFVWIIAFPCYLVARGRYQAMRGAQIYGSVPHGTASPQGPAGWPNQGPIMSAPPQLSPDGQWWWNGTQWVPANAAAPQAPATDGPVQPLGQLG